MTALNKTRFAKVFPVLDRFFFPPTLVWIKQSDEENEVSSSLSNPLQLDYTYRTNFRPECVGSRIPGLIGQSTFLHDGPWDYNIEKNSYHVRCLARFIVSNLYNVPPLSKNILEYTLDIGFALVDPEEVLVFLPPIHFNRKKRKSDLIFRIRRQIKIFIHYSSDPRLVCGISLYVTHNYDPEQKRGKKYWAAKEFTVDQVLETFGVTPPVFRGYRLGRDGKLIIPKKPPRNNYIVKVPIGKKVFHFKRWKHKRRLRRRRLRQKQLRRAYKEKIKNPEERRKLRDRKLRMRKTLIPRRKKKIQKPKKTAPAPSPSPSPAIILLLVISLYLFIELTVLPSTLSITVQTM